MSSPDAGHPTTAPWAPYGALLLGMVSMVVGTALGKHLFPVVGAEGASALRVGLSALLLTLVWRPWRFRLGRSDLGRILLYGGVTGAMNLCFYLSLQTVPLGLALAIEFLGPLTLALVLARRAAHVIWVALAGIGLAGILPLGRGAASSLDPGGLALAASAGVFWALYILLGRRLAHVHSGAAVALGMTVAALIVTPLGVAHAGAGLLHPGVLALGLLVAAASSALPYSMEMYALRHVPPRTFGVALSLEPVLGALAGYAILAERLTLAQGISIVAIVAASIGAVLTQDPARAAPQG